MRISHSAILLSAAAVIGLTARGAAAQGRGQNQEASQNQEARQQLISYLDGLATTHLSARKQAIAQIQTTAEADRRKAMVREKVLKLLGGLPERKGAVAVKTFGT